MEKKHTFAVLAFLRRTNGLSEGEAAVYLRITIDTSRTEISTKIRVPKTKWNLSKGPVKGTSDESKRPNGSSVSFEHRIREIYNRFVEHGKIITGDCIKNELPGVTTKIACC